MIVPVETTIVYVNPLSNDTEQIIIAPYILDKMKIRFLRKFETDADLLEILNNLLKNDLNTSVVLNCGKLTSINTPKYNNSLSLFEFYRQQIEDELLRKDLTNELGRQHVKNIKFDDEYNKSHVVEIVKQKKSNSKKQPLWIKQQSTDLFDNEPMYIYQNTKTGEIIKSKDPNYLEELNAKHTKTKTKTTKNKIIGLTMKDFAFKFNMK